MTTTRDLIELTRGWLMSGQQERLNKLTQTVDENATEVQFAYPLKMVQDGARLSVGLEEMYVWETTGTGSGASAVVERGFNGSVKSQHESGAIVRVSPHFSDFEIFRAINDELRDLSSPDRGLFRIKDVDFEFRAAQFGYPLQVSDQILSVWRVRYDVPGPEEDWPIIPKRFWRLDQSADTTDFPGGLQLVLKVPAFPGKKVRVSYKTGFDPLTGLDDDVEAVSGLHPEAHDIPAMGAAVRLMAGRDLKRTFMEAQPEPRRSEEVREGSVSQAMRPLLAFREERIYAEVMRLLSRFPEAL